MKEKVIIFKTGLPRPTKGGGGNRRGIRKGEGGFLKGRGKEASKRKGLGGVFFIRRVRKWRGDFGYYFKKGGRNWVGTP